MLIVGAYLVVTFGLSATTAWRLEGHDARTASNIPHDTFGAGIGEMTTGVRWNGRIWALPRRDVPRIVIGAAVLLVGLGGLARRRRALSIKTPSPLVNSWALTDQIAATFMSLSLVLCGYLIASQILAGSPPTLALVAQASNQTIDVWLGVAQRLQDSPVLGVS
jgi:hypothetical protein